LGQAGYDASLSQAQVAKALLEKLCARVDPGLDDETRRIVVQALVRRIQIFTIPGPRRRSTRRARVVVEYAFATEKVFVSGSC
jgi:hypothetical protein